MLERLRLNSSRLLSGKGRFVILAASGAAAALPFSLTSLFVLTLAAFIPLFTIIFYALNRERRVFGSLFCFFYAFYFTLYHWFINLYPLDFAGLSELESIFVIICAVTLIPAVHSLIMSICLAAALKLTCRRGAAKCFSAAFAYMLGEFLQSVGPLAFPWGRLFVSQIKCLALLQSASLFGSYFITFLIIMTSSLIALSICEKGKSRVIYVAIAVALFSANCLYGAIRLQRYEYPEEKITAAAIQINMDSAEKWASDSAKIAILRCEKNAASAQTRAAKELGKEIDLFVTSETALPFTLCSDSGRDSLYAHSALEAIDRICQNSGAHFIAGAFYEENGKDYNSLIMYGSDGRADGLYSKQHLVPFGEFLPYRAAIEKIAPALADLNMFDGELTAGSQPQAESLFELNGCKIGGLICFDSVFPELCRSQVKAGARLMVVSTNDSWYKTGAALYEHAAHSIMRAIENNVSVIRSANTGISMMILPTGVVSDSLGEQKEGSAVAELPITSDVTLYTKTGDAILAAGGIYLLISAVFCAFVRLKSRKNKSE